MMIKSTLVLAELASALQCWLSWCYCDSIYGNIFYNSIYLHDWYILVMVYSIYIWLMFFSIHLSATQWM